VPDSDVPWYLTQPIIHRGLHNIHEKIVEHSRTAIRRAIAAGLPIEVDIENSFDQVNFVFHDRVLDKLTNGSGVLREVLAAEIRSCGLIYTQGEPILTLEELLDLVDGRVPLLIEFKNRELAMLPAIKEAARILGRYRGKFSVQSFNPIILEWFQENVPSFLRGLLATDTDTMEARDQYLVCMLRNRIRPHYCAFQCRQLNSWSFQWVLEFGVPVLAFTVRDNTDWDIARTYAENMFFEFIAPDKNDWRRRAATNWRTEVGEAVDRREMDNQPEGLATDRAKGPTPWWARNRSWAPAAPKRPG